ncbi:hypothetical protein EDC01DRAFT_626572 [Geopyxis carbonaria]|nr:hypothetical protein EDC01DRAFT_626572 [Geopyxis carbonaria]
MTDDTRQQVREDHDNNVLQPMAENIPTLPPRETTKKTSRDHKLEAELKKRFGDISLERPGDIFISSAKRSNDECRPRSHSDRQKFNQPGNMFRQGRRSINDRARTGLPDRRDRVDFENGFALRTIRSTGGLGQTPGVTNSQSMPSFRMAGFALAGNCIYDCCKPALSDDGVDYRKVLPHEHNWSQFRHRIFVCIDSAAGHGNNGQGMAKADC